MTEIQNGAANAVKPNSPTQICTLLLAFAANAHLKGPSMSTLDIANKLVDLCKQGKNADAKALYSEEIVSIEAFAPPGGQTEVKGLAALQAKSKWWRDNHEIHSAVVTGPWPHGDRFIVGFQYDVTHKPSGRRIKMEEAALYTVENGKIVREEFFYAGGA